MALRQRDEETWLGSSQADIRDLFKLKYKVCKPSPSDFVDVRCGCGSDSFHLYVDDEPRSAVRVCRSCSAEHAICESVVDFEVKEMGKAECECCCEEFEITVGIAINAAKNQSAIFVGCRCKECGIVGLWGKWKVRHSSNRNLLSRA